MRDRRIVWKFAVNAFLEWTRLWRANLPTCISLLAKTIDLGFVVDVPARAPHLLFGSLRLVLGVSGRITSNTYGDL